MSPSVVTKLNVSKESPDFYLPYKNTRKKKRLKNQRLQALVKRTKTRKQTRRYGDCFLICTSLVSNSFVIARVCNGARQSQRLNRMKAEIAASRAPRKFVMCICTPPVLKLVCRGGHWPSGSCLAQIAFVDAQCAPLQDGSFTAMDKRGH